MTQFLEYESPLKTMKGVFYFILKVLSVLKTLKFLSSLFGHKEKRLYRKDKVNFKIYDATTRLTNNCNTRANQNLKKQRQVDSETWSVNKI